MVDNEKFEKVLERLKADYSKYKSKPNTFKGEYFEGVFDVLEDVIGSFENCKQ